MVKGENVASQCIFSFGSKRWKS